ncbi:MAG TPA: hypothetical protein VK841_22410 [Polyangiaceae bacterium]|jgi:hypothetical protein|nr:hypothetical protein [Polyangiaceae bacterium]
MHRDPSTTIRGRFGGLAFVLVTLASAGAHAQPTPPPAGPAPALAAPPPPVTVSQIAGPEATPEEKEATTAPSPLGFIERLPDTAYPSYPIRGIYGGSLWRTFHGLQWPYTPKTGIGVSGDVWADAGYEHVQIGAPNESSAGYLVQQSRAVLRATPTWTNGRYFVQGQVELVGTNNTQSQTPVAVTTDDVWARIGAWNQWDIQVGRFQQWEIYHVGLGLDLYTQERNGAVLQNDGAANVPPQIYVVADSPDLRPTGIGQAAVHLYPTRYLRFELAGEFGNQPQNALGQNTAAQMSGSPAPPAQNILAIRPVGVFDLGWLKVKAGGIYETAHDVTDSGNGSRTSRGFGGAVQVVGDPYVEFGVNGSYGLLDVYSSQNGSYDAAQSTTTYSLGPFANAQPFPKVVPDLLVGAGYNYTYEQNQLFSTVLNRFGKFRQQQAFFAVQYYLWRQVFIKGVLGYAKGDVAATPTPPLYSNEMWSGRLRLEYLF